MLKTILLILAFSIGQSLHADYFTEYIKYDPQPAFSRIVITNETIRGHRGVDHFSENAKKYENANMFLTRSYKEGSKRIEKVESIDGHEIKSVLTIHPPSGHGFGGAVPTIFLQVYFDRKLVLNCPVGYNHRFDVTVPKIVIHPQEQMLEVFNNKAYGGVVFNFIEHGEVLILNDGKSRSQKRVMALPFAVDLTCLKGINDVKIIDEGIYPRVERKFQKLDEGEKRSFRVAGPFRVFCEDLLDLKFEVNNKQVVRIKEEGEDNYRFDLVE
jgi:hypothetical protein